MPDTNNGDDDFNPAALNFENTKSDPGYSPAPLEIPEKKEEPKEAPGEAYSPGALTIEQKKEDGPAPQAVIGGGRVVKKMQPRLAVLKDKLRACGLDDGKENIDKVKKQILEFNLEGGNANRIRVFGIDEQTRLSSFINEILEFVTDEIFEQLSVQTSEISSLVAGSTGEGDKKLFSFLGPKLTAREKFNRICTKIDSKADEVKESLKIIDTKTIRKIDESMRKLEGLKKEILFMIVAGEVILSEKDTEGVKDVEIPILRDRVLSIKTSETTINMNEQQLVMFKNKVLKSINLINEVILNTIPLWKEKYITVTLNPSAGQDKASAMDFQQAILDKLNIKPIKWGS